MQILCHGTKDLFLFRLKATYFSYISGASPRTPTHFCQPATKVGKNASRLTSQFQKISHFVSILVKFEAEPNFLYQFKKSDKWKIFRLFQAVFCWMDYEIAIKLCAVNPMFNNPSPRFHRGAPLTGSELHRKWVFQEMGFLPC